MTGSKRIKYYSLEMKIVFANPLIITENSQINKKVSYLYDVALTMALLIR